MPKAVVVGAGIGGLGAAWALVRHGWRVEVLEAGSVPNPRAASFDRHRMIRSLYPAGTGYAARMPAAFAAWDRLWSDLGRAHLLRRGVLALSRSEGDWTDQLRSAAGGAPFEVLDAAAVAARFPVFAAAGVRYGLLEPGGGVLLADRILADLAAWLRRRGATIRALTPVDAVDPAAGAVSGPAGGASGDVVVLAAGTGLLRLAPEQVAGCRAHRAAVLYMDPPADLAAAWAAAPGWIDLGGGDDLWGIPALPGIPLKLGLGRHTAIGDPERERAPTPRDEAAILGAYLGRLPGVERFTLRETVVNFYLMAPRERFVLARDRRAVVLSADSGHGFKFGPLSGEDVAEALTGDFGAVARRMAGAA